VFGLDFEGKKLWFSPRHRREIFLITSPKRSFSLWGPSSLILNWYRGLFPLGVMLTTDLHLVLRWGYTFVPPDVFLVLHWENFTSRCLPMLDFNKVYTEALLSYPAELLNQRPTPKSYDWLVSVNLLAHFGSTQHYLYSKFEYSIASSHLL
jgi:hypothetical protein